MAIRKLLDTKMTFDTNLYFKLIGLLYGDYDGDYDGERIRRSRIAYAYSNVWFVIVSLNVLRYSILVFAPRHTVLEYYLCDYGQMISNNGSFRWMMSCGKFDGALFVQTLNLKF